MFLKPRACLSAINQTDSNFVLRNFDGRSTRCAMKNYSRGSCRGSTRSSVKVQRSRRK